MTSDLTGMWLDRIDAGLAAANQRSPLLDYYTDPVGFADDCIDWGDHGGLAPYQREILAELPGRRRVAVRGPHGLGKSMSAAVTVLWFALTRDAAGVDWKVVTTAGAWRQLIHYLWPEIHKWAGRLRPDKIGRGPLTPRELLTLLLRLDHGSAFPAASNRPELIEGAHAGEVLFIYDESKAIANATFDASEGAFSTGEAYALAFSTPGAPAGRFYDIHARKPGYEDWWTRHVTLEEAIADGRINREWAAQRERQWGRDSALFQNRVLGEFYAADEDSVIPLAWVEAAVERWHEWDDAGRPLPEDGKRTVGVDVARGGADETILAHRWGVVVTSLEGHRKRDTMGVTALTQAAIAPGGIIPVVDTTGLGAGVTDRLRELGVEVVAYTGAAKTKRRDGSREFGFVNVRSEAYWRMRELLDPTNDTGVALPPDDELLSDLTTPKWDIVTGVPPKIRVETKEHVVERLGRSPDRGDAVVMAFAADMQAPSRIHSPVSQVQRLPWERPASSAAGRYTRRIA